MPSVTSIVSSNQMVVARPKSVWRFQDAIWIFVLPVLLPVALYFSLQIYAGLGLFPKIWLNYLTAESSLALAIQYALSLVVYAVVIGGLMWWRKAKLQDLGLRRFRLRWLAVVAGLYMAQAGLIIVIFALVQVLLPQVNLDEKQKVLEYGLHGWGWWLSFASSVVIAPVIEEIMFRGIMFTAIARRWPVWLAAIGSSLAFAYLHGQVNVGIYTFVLGLLLCWLYRRSRSIIPGIALHFLNNLVAFWLLTHAIT